MVLTLTETRLQQVRELQELLIAPLRFPSTGDWVDALHTAATRLFDVERSVLILPVAPGRVLIDSPTIDDETLGAIEEGLVGTAPNVNRYGDPVLDRIMARLASARLEVWTRPIAERVSRIPLEETPRFYPELVRPARLDQLLVMGHSLQEGRAMFSLFADGRPEAFDDDAVDVFRLLVPAFQAGARARALAGERRRGFRNSLDLLEEGVAVYRGGNEAYRNRALRRILETEERRKELVAKVARCAGSVGRFVDDGPPDARGVTATLSTGTNRYRLTACHLEGGAGRPVTVLVVIRPARPPFPDEATLQRRYSLTPRQAEVALLVARGASNRGVADRLGISEHTARHHAQRALEKIGARSRKVLALRLLEDRRL